MTAIESTSTVICLSPALGTKEIQIVTPTTAAPSDTIDVSKTSPALKTIYGISICGADGAAVASGTWSGTTITIPSTAATGIKYIKVWGID